MQRIVQLLIILIAFTCINAFGQHLKLHETIIYSDGDAVLRIERKNTNRFIVTNFRTGEKLLKVSFIKSNHVSGEKYKLPKVYSFELKKRQVFERKDIKNENDIFKLLLKNNLLLSSGKLNHNKIHEVFY